MSGRTVSQPVGSVPARTNPAEAEPPPPGKYFHDLDLRPQFAAPSARALPGIETQGHAGWALRVVRVLVWPMARFALMFRAQPVRMVGPHSLQPDDRLCEPLDPPIQSPTEITRAGSMGGWIDANRPPSSGRQKLDAQTRRPGLPALR